MATSKSTRVKKRPLRYLLMVANWLVSKMWQQASRHESICHHEKITERTFLVLAFIIANSLWRIGLTLEKISFEIVSITVAIWPLSIWLAANFLALSCCPCTMGSHRFCTRPNPFSFYYCRIRKFLVMRMRLLCELVLWLIFNLTDKAFSRKPSKCLHTQLSLNETPGL